MENRMPALRDRPPNHSEEPEGTRRSQVIPVEVWLGNDVEPGLIDLPWQERVELLKEAREDPQGPMWGPPEWTKEDERRWQMNSR